MRQSEIGSDDDDELRMMTMMIQYEIRIRAHENGMRAAMVSCS